MGELVIGSEQGAGVERGELRVRRRCAIELAARREQWLEVAALQIVSAAPVRAERAERPGQFAGRAGAGDDLAPRGSQSSLAGENDGAIGKVK